MLGSRSRLATLSALVALSWSSAQARPDETRPNNATQAAPAQPSDASALPGALVISGATGLGLGLLGYAITGVSAADKRSAAAECRAERLSDGGCSASRTDVLKQEAEDQDLLANISVTVAVVGAVTAATGGVLLWQASRAEAAVTPKTSSEDTFWLYDQGNQAKLAFGASAVLLGVGGYYAWWTGRLLERREGLEGEPRVSASLFTELDDDAHASALTATVTLSLGVAFAGLGAGLWHLSGEAPWSSSGDSQALRIDVGPTSVGLSLAF